MIELSKEETLKLHKQMWSWIAEQYHEITDTAKIYGQSISVMKQLWLDHHTEYFGMMADCFLCNYAVNQCKRKYGDNEDNEYDHMCEECPVIWPTGTCNNLIASDEKSLGLYFQLSDILINDEGIPYHKAYMLCKQISELPEHR